MGRTTGSRCTQSSRGRRTQIPCAKKTDPIQSNEVRQISGIYAQGRAALRLTGQSGMPTHTEPRARPFGLPDEYLVDREVAEKLGIACCTLRRWRDDGKTPRQVSVGLAGPVWPRNTVEPWIAELLVTRALKQASRQGQRQNECVLRQNGLAA